MNPQWQPTQGQVDNLSDFFVKPALANAGLDSELAFQFFPLPFYDQFCLFTVHVIDQRGALDGLWDPENPYLEQAVYTFDGTNSAIYAVNRAAPIKLTPENVGDYARFFFTYVFGRHGHFHIVETPEHIPWLPTAPDDAKQNVNKAIRPLLLVPKPDPNFFLLHGTILLQDGLFESDIRVQHDGAIELRDEDLLLEELPVYKEPSAAA